MNGSSVIRTLVIIALFTIGVVALWAAWHLEDRRNRRRVP